MRKRQSVDYWLKDTKSELPFMRADTPEHPAEHNLHRHRVSYAGIKDEARLQWFDPLRGAHRTTKPEKK